MREESALVQSCTLACTEDNDCVEVNTCGALVQFGCYHHGIKGIRPAQNNNFIL